MSHEPDLSDDEWEYEYNVNEKEVFLVDLDLTTVNRTIRSATANRNKRLNEISDKPSNKRKRTGDTLKQKDVAADVELPSGQHDDQSQQPPSAPPEDAEDDNDPRQQTLQLLDLHTGNPLVSYGGQIFSCSWTDMIGTTMFFSQPRETLLYEPELRTSEFDMIGTSRIKLVGTAAKVTPISQDPKAKAPGDNSVRPGQSLGTIRRANAKLNADLRKQATFLEQLMNIKKNRGETDNVQVAMNNQISQVISNGKLQSNVQGHGHEIDELNRRVVRGDAEALERLEQIYLGQSIDDSDDDVRTVEENDDTAERPHRPQSRPVTIESDAEYEIDEHPRIIGTASPSPDPQMPAPNPALKTAPENAGKDSV